MDTVPSRRSPQYTYEIRMKFVLAQLQRQKYTAQTAKTKQISHVRLVSSHHFPACKPGQSTNWHAVVNMKAELDRIDDILHGNIGVMHNHNYHTLQGLVEPLNQPILLMLIRHGWKLNHF